eukprot:15367096-Ditylum_brightwellii.AAC.2
MVRNNKSPLPPPPPPPQQQQSGKTNHRWKKKKGGNDDDQNTKIHPSTITATAAASLPFPQLTKLCLRLFLGTTVTLYILNQKHLLPKPMGRFVSKALFWPTLPITVSRRIGKWWSTDVDDTVILGGAPFGFLNMPERLYHDHGVRAVVNLCDEYHGPRKKYRQLGMSHLWLRTVDHFEPSLGDIKMHV